MKAVIWVIVAILVVLYVRYYFKSPSEVAILQTTLSNFVFDILREKQPVVIQDRVQEVREIKQSWFKHVLTYDMAFDADEHTRWYTNKFKYLVIHPSDACEVLLYPASEKLEEGGAPPQDATLVAIQLAENQLLIIPYRMHYSLSCPSKVRAVGVHDYVTKFLP